MLTVDPMLPTSITSSTDSAFIPPPSTLKKTDSCFGDNDPCSRSEHRVVVLFITGNCGNWIHNPGLANCIACPECLVSAGRCCPSPLTLRLYMRPLAFLQIALLLTTSILPEGRILMSQAHGCSDGKCECSAKSQQNGSCCCSAKKQDEEDSESRCGHHDGKASSDDAARVCCSTASAKSELSEECCLTESSSVGSCEESASDSIATVSSCPCNADSPVVWVCHLPRTLPTRVPAPAIVWTRELNTLGDDRRVRQVDAPPTPPPDNMPC